MSVHHTQAARLRAAATALQEQPLSLQQLFRLHGRAGPGALLVVLAIPCLLPVPGAGGCDSFGGVEASAVLGGATVSAGVGLEAIGFVSGADEL